MQLQERIIADCITTKGKDDRVDSFNAERMHIKFTLQKNYPDDIINGKCDKVRVSRSDYV